MLYAVLMLLCLASLGACWAGSRAHVPLFLLAVIATALAFASDITNPLTISL